MAFTFTGTRLTLTKVKIGCNIVLIFVAAGLKKANMFLKGYPLEAKTAPKN